MTNVFYIYGVIWAFIWLLYELQWSDLCLPLEGESYALLIFIILTSVAIGWCFKEKVQFVRLQKNPHKTRNITKFLVTLFIISFIINRNIPLIEVLRGTSYADIDRSGIPHFNLILVSFSVFYCFYLSYCYVCFKDKYILYEIGSIITYFMLNVQRQNVFICTIFFVNYLLIEWCHQRPIRNRINNYLKIFIAIIMLFYLMGLFGNMRYGSLWDWNDSSMIMSLGRANENYPTFVSDTFFWTYIYLVSPLANLNYNFLNLIPQYDLIGLFFEIIPDFISNRLGYVRPYPMLLVNSLTVCTGYVSPFAHFGAFGVLLIYLLSITLVTIIITICNKHNPDKVSVVTTGLTYFLVMNFFDNTFTYNITWLVMLFSLITSQNLKFKI